MPLLSSGSPTLVRDRHEDEEVWASRQVAFQPWLTKKGPELARNGAPAEPSDGCEEGSAKLRMARNGASAEPSGISVLLKTARSQVGLDLWCGGRMSKQGERECI